MNNLMEVLDRLKKDIGIHKYIWLDTLYQKILEIKPRKIVEFGTKTGLTSITMALALKEIGKGKIITYDCFDLSVDNKVSDIVQIEQTIKNINKWRCDDIIEVHKMDFYEWLKDPNDFDLMYLDIDNDGDKIQKLYDCVLGNEGSVILFEGGSQERDIVSWMTEKNRVTINSVKDYVNYTVIDKRFPSLSMIRL